MQNIENIGLLESEVPDIWEIDVRDFVQSCFESENFPVKNKADLYKVILSEYGDHISNQDLDDAYEYYIKLASLSPEEFYDWWSDDYSFGIKFEKKIKKLKAAKQTKEIAAKKIFKPNRDKNAIIDLVVPYGYFEIAEREFEDCENLTTVTLPDGFKKLGAAAFLGCTNLTNINLPDSIAEIGRSAFTACINLTSIKLPDSLVELGENAFARTGIYELKIPDTITSLASGLFFNSAKLKAVILPTNLKSIEEEAFYGCTALETLTIPSSVISIGDRAFKYCNNLTIICNRGSVAEKYAKEHGIPMIIKENISSNEACDFAKEFELYENMWDSCSDSKDLCEKVKKQPKPYTNLKAASQAATAIGSLIAGAVTGGVSGIATGLALLISNIVVDIYEAINFHKVTKSYNGIQELLTKSSNLRREIFTMIDKMGTAKAAEALEKLDQYITEHPELLNNDDVEINLTFDESLTEDVSNLNLSMEEFLTALSDMRKEYGDDQYVDADEINEFISNWKAAPEN